MAAALIQLATQEKQLLLEMDDAARLLKALHSFYRRELPLLRFMPPTDQGVFSVN